MKTLITILISLLLFWGCSSSEKSLWIETTVATGNISRSTVAIDSTTGTVYVAWIGTKESVSNVYLSRRKTGETEFSDPVRVNSIPGNAAIVDQSPPQVVVAPKGFIYVTWVNQTKIEGRQWPVSDVYVARSENGGRTFAPGVNAAVNRPSYPSGQYFHDIAVGPGGIVYVSWLDSRAGSDKADKMASMQSNTSGHNMESMHHMEGSSMQIRVARSTNHAKSFDPGKVIARGTCQCCRTAVTVGSDGTVYVAWRQVFEGQIRDIAIARSENNGKSFTDPKRVHHDNWKIMACPHAGPSVVTDNGQVFVFWFTGAPGKAGVYMAKAKEEDLNFEKPVLLPGASATSQVEADADDSGNLWFVWENYNKGIIKIGNYIDGNINKSFATIQHGRLPSVAVSNKVAALTWLASDSVKVRMYKL